MLLCSLEKERLGLLSWNQGWAHEEAGSALGTCCLLAGRKTVEGVDADVARYSQVFSACSTLWVMEGGLGSELAASAANCSKASVWSFSARRARRERTPVEQKGCEEWGARKGTSDLIKPPFEPKGLD
jgi:hypothetical protein